MTIFSKYISKIILLNQWWRHCMKIFVASLALFKGNNRLYVHSPHRELVMRSVDFFFVMLNKLYSWVAGDLRRHDTFVTSLWWSIWVYISQFIRLSLYPANKVHDKNVIITSKRRFGVMITYLLRSLLGMDLASYSSIRWFSHLFISLSLPLSVIIVSIPLEI